MLLSTGTLALASNTSSSLRDIPHAPGEARLVWRVTTNNEMLFPPLTALLSAVVEPDVRSANAIPAAEPIRVAMLRLANATGVSIADGLVPSLRYNGKSVAENGDRFRQFPVAEGRDDDPAVEPAVAEQLWSFAPHVIVLAGPGTSVIPGIEKGWPRGAKHRPSYILGEANVHAPFVALVARDPALRRRFYAIDAALGSDALTKYVHHYNEAFTPPMNAAYATSAPYDAFYAFAYAAAALGEKPITGKDLAAAISRLLPPGDPIDVGPAGIYKAFYSLAAGKNIDLQGAATTLDFDPETGGATADMAVFCVTPGAPGDPPHPVESGLVFRARSRKLEGAMRCP